MTRIALVFDDGYRASLDRLIPLFEARGLPAVLACVAAPERSPFAQTAIGWDEMVDLHRRGHRIHPHGLTHANKATMPHAEAVAAVTSCLDLFTAHGIPVADTVFHYPYNQGTPALHDLLLTRVRAVRVSGSGFHTAADLAGRVWTCTGHGPGPCDDHVQAALDRAIRERPDAVIIMAHGVEGEGWGPLRLATVARLLDQIQDTPGLVWWPLDEPSRPAG